MILKFDLFFLISFKFLQPFFLLSLDFLLSSFFPFSFVMMESTDATAEVAEVKGPWEKAVSSMQL